MKDNSKILLGTACFLGGMIAGFFISPVKKGVTFISTGGNRCTNKIGELKDSNEVKTEDDEMNMEEKTQEEDEKIN